VSFGNVEAGKRYRYRATGCVEWNGSCFGDPPGNVPCGRCRWFFNPDGYLFCEEGCAGTPVTRQLGGTFSDCYSRYTFSLVGRIGGSEQCLLQLGSSGTFLAPISGELFLFINNILFCCNSGSFDVCIEPIDVTLEKCPASFIPTDGGTVTIRAFVTPNTYRGKFKFKLFDVSTEPGSCMNAPKQLNGNYTDAAWDLQFPDQGDFVITRKSNHLIAETTASDLNEKTIVVQSFDYGAYGKIRAEFIVDGIGPTIVAFEQDGTNPWTKIPKDDDNNNIADAALQNSGPGTSYAADSDNDDTPTGDGTLGDGLSRYEEYRGFMVQGVHTPLDVTKKDVFVRNINVTDAGISGFFTTDSLTAPVHAIRDDEWRSRKPRKNVVNFNDETAHISDQQAIKVEDGSHKIVGPYWGLSRSLPITSPWVPHRQDYCYVNVKLIKDGTKINKTGGISATETNIPVENASLYRSRGTTRIDNEQITYTGVNRAENTLTGSTRGAFGTDPVPHKNKSKVYFFVNEADFIKMVFAHEAGHVVNLDDQDPDFSRNIMSVSDREPVAGSVLYDGFWDSFIGVSSALTDRFRVKE
jgi:hypothetical protein